MAGITLRNVSKIYNEEVVAVNKVNIEVADKEFLVLVGPSGCGKSTILRMIAGLEEVTEGDLYIGDLRVNDVPPKARDIAMVFQNYALYPHMTVFDNIAFSLKLKRLPKQEIQKRVHETAEILGIEDLLGRKPKALSGGQRQRVAVGRAIIRKPKVFLFDEPLSNLDAKLRVQMRTEISRLHSKINTTMVYVTHDQVEAMTMGNRIVVLKDGVVQQIDSPLNIYNCPENKFVAEFIGSPSMNLLKGQFLNGNGLQFKSEKLSIQFQQLVKTQLRDFLGKELILGIRPEDFREKATGMTDEASVTLNLDLIEPMGHETHLYLSDASCTIVARVKSSTPFRVGDQVTLYFDTKKIRLFDGRSGNALNR